MAKFIVTRDLSFTACVSLVPRHGGGGGERAPGTHCFHMPLIATEFRGDCFFYMYVRILVTS